MRAYPLASLGSLPCRLACRLGADALPAYRVHLTGSLRDLYRWRQIPFLLKFHEFGIAQKHAPRHQYADNEPNTTVQKTFLQTKMLDESKKRFAPQMKQPDARSLVRIVLRCPCCISLQFVDKMVEILVRVMQ